jgi:hypothetical protein
MEQEKILFYIMVSLLIIKLVFPLKSHKLKLISLYVLLSTLFSFGVTSFFSNGKIEISVSIVFLILIFTFSIELIIKIIERYSDKSIVRDVEYFFDENISLSKKFQKNKWLITILLLSVLLALTYFLI